MDVVEVWIPYGDLSRSGIGERIGCIVEEWWEIRKKEKWDRMVYTYGLKDEGKGGYVLRVEMEGERDDAGSRHADTEIGGRDGGEFGIPDASAADSSADGGATHLKGGPQGDASVRE